jgi:hypothetical protein
MTYTTDLAYILGLWSYEGCECVYRPLTRHLLVFSYGIVALSKYLLNSFAVQYNLD